MQSASRQAYEQAVHRLYASVRPDPGWTSEILDGPIGPTLVRCASTADLLVVGTHEHRGLARLLHGSVSHHRLTRASCPVAAIPPVDAAAGAGSSPSRTEAGAR